MRHAEVRRRDRMAEIEKFAAENEIPVQNAQLLNTALTHTSYANEHKNEVIHDNERLEFLGDAILDLVIGEYLFLRFPSWPERRRASSASLPVRNAQRNSMWATTCVWAAEKKCPAAAPVSRS